jgi:hypothetical protein
MQIELGASKGQLLALVFGQDALAASQTDVQLNVALGESGQAVTGYAAPWAGEIVAVGYATSAAATAGSLTIGATIGGTEDADSTASVTTGTSGYTLVPRGKMVFNAGDLIGAEITTSASWDGTTADLSVVVYALVEMGGI